MRLFDRVTLESLETKNNNKNAGRREKKRREKRGKHKTQQQDYWQTQNYRGAKKLDYKRMADALLLLSQFNAESLTPNVFSLIAARYLSGLMGDLFRLGHVSFCSHYPMLASTIKWSDELYLILALLVEHSSLQSKSSGFTEGFFGLKREALYAHVDMSSRGSAFSLSSLNVSELGKVVRSKTRSLASTIIGRPIASSSTSSSSSSSAKHVEVGPIQTQHKVASMAELVVVPYVQNKLQEAYSYYTSDQPDVLLERRSRMAQLRDDLRHRGGVLVRLRVALFLLYLKLLVKYFPLLRTAFRLCEAFCLVRFALGRSQHFSPIQALSSVVLRRVTMADRMSAQGGGGRPSLANRVATVAGLGLSAVFVALRVLEWSRRGGGGSGGDATGLPSDDANAENNGGGDGVVPFPRHSRPPKGKELVKGQCLVCHQPLVNPAVNVVSGAVGCYLCLQTFVAENGKCPLTGQRTTSLHIRRLYEG